MFYHHPPKPGNTTAHWESSRVKGLLILKNAKRNPTPTVKLGINPC